MYFKQFYLGCLAHASYLIGSRGEAIVVDPQRDVELYLTEAQEQGLKIKFVLETHLHADFVSGHQELAERTGAEILIGAEAHAEFPHRALQDGDQLRLGDLDLQVLTTPGHTPEGVCLKIVDHEAKESPLRLLTGDTLFIGDVGRPDLAGSKGYTAADMAGLLYDSLRDKVLPLPDSTEIYPAHGAGSMCGRNISKETSSTLGEQRRSNYALQPMTREAFVAMMTAELPDAPAYFAADAEINRRGAPSLQKRSPLPRLSTQDTLGLLERGAVLLDVRGAQDFAAGHIPGSISIGLGGQFASWSGVLLSMQQPIVLIAEDDATAEEAAMRLARVGFENVSGQLGGGVASWSAEPGCSLLQTNQLTADELQHNMAAKVIAAVVDVRKPGEFKAEHIEGAVPLELSRLQKEASTALPDRDAPLAITCQGGYRSIAAVSVLEKLGYRNLFNVIGGMGAWQAFQASAPHNRQQQVEASR